MKVVSSVSLLGDAHWLEGESSPPVHTCLVLDAILLLCKVLHILCGCLLAPPGEVVSHPVVEGIVCELGFLVQWHGEGTGSAS